MDQNSYRHLAPRPGSSYQQYFVQGTRTRAETIYRYLTGPDAMTPEQAANDCGLPLDAVLECIQYCERNQDLLREERSADWDDMRARGLLLQPEPTVQVPTA